MSVATGSVHFARAMRARRLFRHDDGRLAVVPLDHAISDGPIVPDGMTMDGLVGQLADAGVDAVVVHKGALRRIDPARFDRMSLIVHLSASTSRAGDPDAKYLVTGVEEALRLGADAVSVHVNLGSADERDQIGDLGRVAELCDRWNLPLLAMVYPRGPEISDPRDPEVVRHAAILAADLGADIVKTPYAGSVTAMAEVTDACPVPLIVAGGPRIDDEDELARFVGDAISGGAAGVAMGRNIFQHKDPLWAASRVSRLVHQVPGDRRDQFAEGTHR